MICREIERVKQNKNKKDVWKLEGVVIHGDVCPTFEFSLSIFFIQLRARKNCGFLKKEYLEKSLNDFTKVSNFPLLF